MLEKPQGLEQRDIKMKPPGAESWSSGGPKVGLRERQWRGSRVTPFLDGELHHSLRPGALWEQSEVIVSLVKVCLTHQFPQSSRDRFNPSSETRLPSMVLDILAFLQLPMLLTRLIPFLSIPLLMFKFKLYDCILKSPNIPSVQ